jgi:hypothetical protein
MSNRVSARARQAAILTSGPAKSDKKVVVAGERHDDYANDALFHMLVRGCGILWGAAMYVAFEPNIVQSLEWVKGTFAFLSAFVMALVVGPLMYIRGKYFEASENDRESLQRLSVLSRSKTILYADFSWKAASYGVIALVPRLALPFSEKDFMSAMAKHNWMIVTLVVHLAVVVIVFMALKSEARLERDRVMEDL